MPQYHRVPTLTSIPSTIERGMNSVTANICTDRNAYVPFFVAIHQENNSPGHCFVSRARLLSRCQTESTHPEFIHLFRVVFPSADDPNNSLLISSQRQRELSVVSMQRWSDFLGT
jgi:hypothetical protein